MTDLRQATSWLLLGLLTVVGAGAAVLGVSQAPKNAPLQQAVDNTLAAPNFSQVITETTPQAKRTDYLVWEAPDKLGGYVQSGDKRTYVYIIGSTEYQSLTVPAGTPSDHLVFYKQQSQAPAAAVDLTHHYLQFVKSATHVVQNGNTYAFSLTQGGQTGQFEVTVNGPYVSELNLTVASASVQLVISQVGTSPPVALPSGAKVIQAPTGLTPSTGGS